MDSSANLVTSSLNFFLSFTNGKSKGLFHFLEGGDDYSENRPQMSHDLY
jgi:hypothetical protein